MNMKNLSRDEVLRAIGLETRRDFGDYFWPAFGFFGLGVAVGSAVGMLFAPKPGRELRHDVSRRLGRDIESIAVSGGAESEREYTKPEARSSAFHS